MPILGCPLCSRFYSCAKSHLKRSHIGTSKCVLIALLFVHIHVCCNAHILNNKGNMRTCGNYTFPLRCKSHMKSQKLLSMYWMPVSFCDKDNIGRCVNCPFHLQCKSHVKRHVKHLHLQASMEVLNGHILCDKGNIKRFYFCNIVFKWELEG